MSKLEDEELESTDTNQLSKVFETIEVDKEIISIFIKNYDLPEEEILSLIEKLAQHSNDGIKITLDYDYKLKEVLDKLVIGFVSNLKIIALNINTTKLSDEAIVSLTDHISNSNYLNSFKLICKLNSNQEAKITKALKNNFSMLGEQTIDSQSSELPKFKGYTERNKKALIKVKEFIEAVVKEDKPLPSGTEYEKIYELYQRVNQTQLRELLLKSDTCKFKDMDEVNDVLSGINNHIMGIFWQLIGLNISGNSTPDIVLEENQSFEGIITFMILGHLSRITGGKNLTAIKCEHKHTEDGCKLSGDNTDDQSI